MQRRKFIANSCLACASIAGGSILISMLSGCSGLQRVTAADTKSVFSFPATAFAEQQVLIVQRTDAEFDALVVKKNDKEYITIEMKCSHQNQPLTATQNGFYCASHGSRFDLSGEVITEPATQPLKKFKTELNQQNITIHFNS